MKPEYFSGDPQKTLLEFLQKNPDFKGEGSKDLIEVLAAKPAAIKQLQGASDYVKIIGLQFEELYQDLSLADLREQAARLKHRLIERYVNTQKTQLAEQMHDTTDEVQLQKLIKKANPLNNLIKVVED